MPRKFRVAKSWQSTRLSPLRDFTKETSASPCFLKKLHYACFATPISFARNDENRHLRISKIFQNLS
ncbi:hypothetical protein [Helicobacter macacae]|uniref:hypothetical protein n=1 Tax=Helicobacter macacae TaxID=398626 RepID=UPI0003FA954F|nr:hypothetical protein [Helicobacter macacae]